MPRGFALHLYRRQKMIYEVFCSVFLFLNLIPSAGIDRGDKWQIFYATLNAGEK